MKSNREVAYEVIAGLWGNGSERRSRLEAAGYNYDEIQKVVNDILAGNDVDGSVEPTENDQGVLEVRVDLNKYSTIKLIIEA